jgi:hypothetical protein
LAGDLRIIMPPPGGASPGTLFEFERSRPCICRRIVSWSGTPGVGVAPGFIFIDAFLESLIGVGVPFDAELTAVCSGILALAGIAAGDVNGSAVSVFAFTRALAALFVFMLDTLVQENKKAVAKIKPNNNEILFIKTSNKNAI